jgi:hypothetical protein
MYGLIPFDRQALSCTSDGWRLFHRQSVVSVLHREERQVSITLETTTSHVLGLTSGLIICA